MFIMLKRHIKCRKSFIK